MNSVKTGKDASGASRRVAQHGKSDGLRDETLSLADTAAILGINESEVSALIAKKALCAAFDKPTDSWKVQLACVLARKNSAAGNTPPTPSTPPPTGNKEPSCPLDSSSSLDDCFDMSPPGKLWEESERQATGQVESSTYVEPGFSRALSTGKSIEAVMDSLDFAAVRLEGAMYRIGYLESQIENLTEQLVILPELRSRAARAFITERECKILKETVALREQELAKANTHLAHQQARLDLASEFIGRLTSNFLFRIFSWLIGIEAPEDVTSPE